MCPPLAVCSQYMSTRSVRRSATSVSLCVSATFLLLTGYVTGHGASGHITAVCFITAAVGFLGIGMSGHCANHIDLSPKYAFV